MRFPKDWPLARTFVALASAHAIGRIVRFLYLVAIARFLIPDEVGIYSYGIALYLAFLGFASFGQSVFLATRIGRRPRSTATIVRHSLTVVTITTVLATAAIACFLWLTPHHAAERLPLTFFVLALVARSFAIWARGCFTALERAGWIPRYELMFRGGEAVVGTAMLALGAELAAICVLHFLVWLAEAIASLLLLRRRTAIRVWPGLEPRILAQVARISLVYAVSLLLMQVFAQIGIVGLKLAEPDAALVAQFAIALQLVTTIMIFPAALGQAMLPGLSRAHRTNNLPDIRAVATMLKASLVIGGVLAILLGVFGPWLVALFFGSRYATAGETLVSLAWALGPYAAAGIAQQSLNALGARLQAALVAGAMVATFTALICLPLPLAPLSQATAAFIAATAIGALGGALALTAPIGLSGVGWWVRPAALLALVGAIFALAHTTAQGLTTLLLIPALLIGVGVCRVFTRDEFAAIASKLSRRRQAA